MANIAKLITDLAKRAKVSTEVTEALTGVINANGLASIEVADDAYTAVLGGLYDLDSAESVIKPQVQKALKAEIFNGIDAGIKQALEGELSTDELADLEGQEGTKKKLDAALRIIKGKKPQSSGDSDSKIANLTRALEDAKAETRAKDAEKATAISELEAKHKSDIFKIGLKADVLGRTDIAKEQKENRHFVTNFLSDLNDYLTAEGIKINPDNREILKADDTPYFDKANNKVGFEDLLTVVIDKYDYKKKSETPERREIEVERSGQENVIKDTIRNANSDY